MISQDEFYKRVIDEFDQINAKIADLDKKVDIHVALGKQRDEEEKRRGRNRLTTTHVMIGVIVSIGIAIAGFVLN